MKQCQELRVVVVQQALPELPVTMGLDILSQSPPVLHVLDISEAMRNIVLPFHILSSPSSEECLAFQHPRKRAQ